MSGSHHVSDYQLKIHTRRLQQEEPAEEGTTAKKPNTITNPVYCIRQHDSFIFFISSPTHFPVYMKNSVMNTNPIFDYGAFENLQTSMLSKQAEKPDEPSTFAFTFKDAGSYVFQDSAND